MRTHVCMYIYTYVCIHAHDVDEHALAGSASPNMLGQESCEDESSVTTVEPKAKKSSNLIQQINDVEQMQNNSTPDVKVIVRVRPLLEADHCVCKRGQECTGLITKNASVAFLDGTLPVRMENEQNAGDERMKKIYWKMLEKKNVFTFDAVLTEKDNTETVFTWTGQAAVDEVVRGVNAVVFAYGQTGSGKTYSLLGDGIAEGQPAQKNGTKPITSDTNAQDTRDNDDDDKEGIAIRTFQCLLGVLQQLHSTSDSPTQYTIEVSALQIYMNHVYDLLCEEGQEDALRIRMHRREHTLSKLGGEVCDLLPKETYKACSDEEAFRALLQHAVSKRKQSSTNMSDTSSRSHLILTLAVKNASSGSHEGRREHVSKLLLIDLAGNERDSSWENLVNKDSLREEGIAANASLLALNECLHERATRSLAAAASYKCIKPGSKAPTGRKHGKEKDLQGRGCATARSTSAGPAAYRKSAITRLLKEYLESAKIFFLACCSPAASSVAATRHTLEYANTVKYITTSAEDSALLFELGVNVEVLPHASLIQYGRIPRSDVCLTVPLNCLRESVVRVMVSHKWLLPEQKLPDNLQNEKHQLLCALFERLQEGGWIRSFNVLDVVEWVDFGERSLHEEGVRASMCI
jgi:hypothetical protein